MKGVAGKKTHVQIGEVKTGGAGDTLTAILGSCIGLGLLDSTNGKFGLAHCLLAKSSNLSDEIGGRHVDQAVNSLQRLLEVSDRDMRKLQGIVVGGANMTLPSDVDPKRLVGQINADFAYKTLREHGLRNIHRDVGGSLGRQITINCTTGEFVVSAIPRLEGTT